MHYEKKRHNFQNVQNDLVMNDQISLQSVYELLSNQSTMNIIFPKNDIYSPQNQSFKKLKISQSDLITIFEMADKSPNVLPSYLLFSFAYKQKEFLQEEETPSYDIDFNLLLSFVDNFHILLKKNDYFNDEKDDDEILINKNSMLSIFSKMQISIDEILSYLQFFEVEKEDNNDNYITETTPSENSAAFSYNFSNISNYFYTKKNINDFKNVYFSPKNAMKYLTDPCNLINSNLNSYNKNHNNHNNLFYSKKKVGHFQHKIKKLPRKIVLVPIKLISNEENTSNKWNKISLESIQNAIDEIYKQLLEEKKNKYKYKTSKKYIFETFHSNRISDPRKIKNVLQRTSSLGKQKTSSNNIEGISMKIFEELKEDPQDYVNSHPKRNIIKLRSKSAKGISKNGKDEKLNNGIKNESKINENDEKEITDKDKNKNNNKHIKKDKDNEKDNDKVNDKNIDKNHLNEKNDDNANINKKNQNNNNINNNNNNNEENKDNKDENKEKDNNDKKEKKLEKKEKNKNTKKKKKKKIENIKKIINGESINNSKTDNIKINNKNNIEETNNINIVNKNEVKNKETNIEENSNNINNISYPFLIKKLKKYEGLDMFICGSLEKLGRWDTSKAIKMDLTKRNNIPYFVKYIDLQRSDFPFEYKYFYMNNGEEKWIGLPFNNHQAPQQFYDLIKNKSEKSISILNINIQCLNNTETDDTIWESNKFKLMQTLLNSYSDIFFFQGMNKIQYQYIYQNLNGIYDSISVFKDTPVDIFKCCIIYNVIKYTLNTWGQFLLSSTPIESDSNDLDDSVPRTCTWVSLKQINGINLLFFNVELDNKNKKDRLPCVKVILSEIKKIKNKFKEVNFIVLGGCFYCEEKDNCIKLIKESGFNLIKTDNIYHNFSGIGKKHWDYIFWQELSEQSNIDIKNILLLKKETMCNENIKEKYFIDHFPIFVEFMQKNKQ